MCAFKHDDILNTYKTNSATSMTSFFYLRAGVMEIVLYLGDPRLILNFPSGKKIYISLYTSVYINKIFFLIEIIF